MSYAPQVTTDNSGEFYGNALRFDTYNEALNNASDLMQRWMLVREFRAIYSLDPVTHSFINNQLKGIDE